jgi:hypothetical protein
MGFKGSREVNKGCNDPHVIGLEQIVAALKATGTYRGGGGRINASSP